MKLLKIMPLAERIKDIVSEAEDILSIKSRENITINLLCYISFLILFLPKFGINAMAATRRTFTPRISFQEQYDKHIDQYTDKDDTIDRITSVSPGLNFLMEMPTTNINLDYEANLSFYRKHSYKDNVRHQGNAYWQQQLNPKLRLDISDNFITSEDRLLVSERDDDDMLTRRRIYYLNNGQASLSWQLSRESQVSIGYINRYLEDKSNLYEDSINHEGFLNLDKWFNQRFGIGLTSRIGRGVFKQAEEYTGEGTKDFEEYEGDVRLNYRWHPTKVVYARYNLLGKDFEELDRGGETVDFWVHQSALGLNLGLSPRTDFGAEGGYFVQDYVNGRKNDGATLNANLNTTSEKTSFIIRSGAGFSQDYFTSDNLGSSKFKEISASADYKFNKNLSSSASLSYRFDEFFGGDDQWDRDEDLWKAGAGVSISFWKQSSLFINGSYLGRDINEMDSLHRDEDMWKAGAGVSISFWKQSSLSIDSTYWEKDITEGESYYRDDNVWQFNAGISLPFQRWLTLFMGGSYSENDSTDPAYEFRDYSIMFRLTGAYPVMF